MFDYRINDPGYYLSSQDEKKLLESVEKALAVSHEVLAGPADILVDIFVRKGWNRKNLPVEGSAGRRDLCLIIDPKHPVYRNPEDEHFIISTVAHEYHHIVRGLGVGYGKSLGRSLVSEGLAQSFEKEVTGKIPSIGIAVSARKLAAFEYVIRDNFFRRADFVCRDILIGDCEKGYPKWLGYSFSFALIEPWLQDKGMTAAQAVNVAAAEVLRPWRQGKVSIEENAKRVRSKKPSLVTGCKI